MNLRRLGLLFLLILLVLGGCVAKTTQRRASADPPPPITWHPSVTTHWQIQLAGAFDAAVNADIYDLDPFTTQAATVTTLVNSGKRVMCHLDVGASDLGLPDAGLFPSRVLGAVDGPRRWLDIRDWAAIRPVLADRLDLCRTKGFQAVDADATTGYAARSGFALTAADQVTFDRNVADLARTYGLAVGVRTTPQLAATVAPMVDFTVVAGCFAARDCGAYSRFVTRGKAVYDVETGSTSGDFCDTAMTYGFSAIVKPDARLTGPVRSC